MFKIDDEASLPRALNACIRETMDRLRVGQSFHVPGVPFTVVRSTVYGYRFRYDGDPARLETRSKRKFTVRREDDGYRIGRIK